MDAQRLKDIKERLEGHDAGKYHDASDMAVGFGEIVNDALQLVEEIERLKAERPLVAGDKVRVTSLVPGSGVYPWVVPGIVGTVNSVVDSDYPYLVEFEGAYKVGFSDTLTENPSLFFNRSEIELEESK